VISDLNQTVKKAAAIALDYFGRVTINYKSDNSVVTEADLRVEEFLSRELSHLIPSSSFLGEEGTGGDICDHSGYLWIVDPIDGSSGYSQGLPIWGISVALVKDCRPVMASVYFPMVDSLFWYDEDGRGYINDISLERLKPEKQIRSESFICVPSNLYRDCGIAVSMKSRSFGSSCYHILQVARDAAYAAILSKFHIWDLAASQTIAQSTGAEIFDLNGRSYSLTELIKSGEIPEPLIITYRDRFAKVKQRLSHGKD
jgi:myo-inositol-1(or 4)-monophosphatase